MTDDQFKQLCETYGFAPSRDLRAMIDAAQMLRRSENCPSCEYNKERAANWRREAYKLNGTPLPDEDRAEIYRAQAEEEIKKHGYQKVSERTVRTTITRVRVFAREIPINPTLLKAADEMERMLTELIELRGKK